MLQKDRQRDLLMSQKLSPTTTWMQRAVEFAGYGGSHLPRKQRANNKNVSGAVSKANSQVQPSQETPKRPTTVTKACMHMRPRAAHLRCLQDTACSLRHQRGKGYLWWTGSLDWPSVNSILTVCRIQSQQSGGLYKSFRWQATGPVVQKQTYLR